MQPDLDERLSRARCSLDGLSVGDAYGNHHGKNARKRLAETWEFSDDTMMALSIVSNLRQYGKIDPDRLALSFAIRREGKRGYGRGVSQLLKQVLQGKSWEKASTEQFGGIGSFGNGAAMRVAPLGAFYADNLLIAIEQAQYSAIVTHGHPEGIIGAITVAVAAGLAFQFRELGNPPDRQEFLTALLPYLPESTIKRKLCAALDLPPDTSPADAAEKLGRGRPAIAQQTVPFAIWSAASSLADYEQAIRRTASVQGDVDTNCAIVGGIVVMYTGIEGIPKKWLSCREPLPAWPFVEQDQ